MKILFDLSDRTETYSSVTIYAARILAGFRANKYTGITLLCHPGTYDFFRNNFPEYPCIKAHTDKGNFITIGYKWSKQINNIACDLVLSCKGWMSFLFTRRKIVQIVHDIQQLKTDHGKTLWKYRIFWPIFLLRSYRIITISDFVRQDIHKTYPFIPLSKMEVIHNSVIMEKPKEKRNPVSEKYLLYISRLVDYKNIITLLRAFNLLKDEISHKLVIIGKPTDYWKDMAVPFIKKNSLESRIIHIDNPVREEGIIQYYSSADLFVHPSLMEGFGYPPIEAAILETPVLSSKETALYETTMGLLNYYEPANDEKAMARQIKRLLQNPPSLEKRKEISDTLQKQYDYRLQAKKIYEYLLNIYHHR